MRLLLVRHGQTPSNVRGILDTTVPGPGLTSLGSSQVERIPDALAGEPIEQIYASTQRRAQLTAEPLCRALGVSLRVRDGIREISAGDLEKRGDPDAIHEYHRASFAWVSGNLDERVPGGEDGHEVFARVDAVVSEAEKGGASTAAIVAHGQLLRVWAAARVGRDGVFAAENPLANTGLIVLNGTTDRGWELETWRSDPLGETANPADSESAVSAEPIAE